jgi:hypothetical protein
MKKYFPVLLIVFGLLLLSCPSSLAAGETAWTIKWNSNGSLDEKINISGHNVVVVDKEWNSSRSGQELVLTRHIKNWQEYSKLNDRLPLEIKEKNFLLLKSSSLTMQEETLPGCLYEQFSNLADARLSIEVSGIIRDTTADRSINSTATWNLGNSTALPLINLQAIVFDGVILGISFFVLCFTIIFIIYLNHIRKVNQLITQEYSLEKAAEDFALEENKEDE